ncbi:MAG: DUF4174 domain-containing protein [Pararhodobacter sp.]
MKSVLLALLLILAPAAWAQATGADAPVQVVPQTTDEAPTPVVDDAGETIVPPGGLLILDAADVDPNSFLWELRILAVMADTPEDPAFIRQMRDIELSAGDLALRDVVVLVDSDRTSGSPLRQRLRPRGFMLAVIDKDGEIKQRRPAPRSIRELTAIIDRFPLVRQEALERRPAGR